ncbi:XdhC family protein [Flaviaesturariibacter amylovorans]|uniref:XdhC family protein n=1 Tax=Flaviaesturariibacter amylovorans TaxID=1084520 RepID=A0ABP8GZ47_9BACT
MNTWHFIHGKLEVGIPVLLLWVLESEGSSPGRRGFKMAVSADGAITGSIGGGIMEHKLVEKARALLQAGLGDILLQRQYHDKEHSRDQSGLICSGSQLVAFVPIGPEKEALVNSLLEAYAGHHDTRIRLSPGGFALEPAGHPSGSHFAYRDDTDWSYSERLDQRPVIHIIGGGHVGLALSQQMTLLGFYIRIYDNRPELNTFAGNTHAQERVVADYETIDALIGDRPDDYVVIMTFGYRDDKTVFRRLLGRKYAYLGMMGSESKVLTLMRELQQEGISPEAWQHCFIPVGLPIYSKTPAEIAVSIAAEIIREKNRELPTGRSGLPLSL